MKLSNVFVVILLSTTLLSFSQKNKIVTISNPLNIDREVETVELSKTSLGLKSSDKLEKYRVKELGTTSFLISQCVDENGDGINDVLLFQPNHLPSLLILHRHKQLFLIFAKRNVGWFLAV